MSFECKHSRTWIELVTTEDYNGEMYEELKEFCEWTLKPLSKDKDECTQCGAILDSYTGRLISKGK